MPNVAFEKQSDVNAQVIINLSKEELETKLKEELKKAQKTANMKGFRKGKAPMSTLRKMMGNEMLGRILDQEINESLYGYIDENKLEIIFSPMPAEQQELLDIDAKRVSDVTFAYDLALRPTFEIKLPATELDKFVLKTDDEFIEERLTGLRKQLGETKEVENDIQKNDVLNVVFTELAKVNPKKDGVTNETKLFLDGLTEALQEELLGKDAGYTTDVDIYEVEKQSNETYVRKYLMGLEDEAQEVGRKFRLQVVDISRNVPAELDEDFFKKFDPSGEITDEEALRVQIVEDNASGFNRQGESMLEFQIQKELVEGSEIELPTDFMQRLNAEQDQNYERFERGVRWMLIRSQYAKEKDLEVTDGDIRSAAADQLIGMMGGQRPEWLNDGFVDNYAARVMEDEKQRDELIYRTLETKIMASLREEVKTKEIGIDADAFNEKIQEFNKEFGADEEE
jgi:trigger factor